MEEMLNHKVDFLAERKKTNADFSMINTSDKGISVIVYDYERYLYLLTYGQYR